MAFSAPFTIRLQMNMPIQTADFAEFFTALHGQPPFPWQVRLAKQVCEEGWPDVIDLPTASGKTACLDIALFALAIRQDAPRRIFFVVDRRIIVNEAFLRMQKVSETLSAATQGIVFDVAKALRAKGGEGCTHPLATYELRGGIYRDESWVRNPLQAMVITSTVDQVGSRLLFRGYGVSENARPIHAGLIANDSLIFLDEAHCSTAFAQTLQAVERYRSAAWAEEPVKATFRFVEMTATPVRHSERVFRLDDADRSHEVLRKRLTASKPTQLVISQNKHNDWEKLAKTLSDKALSEAAAQPTAKRIAVIVNRIATARFVHGFLCRARGENSVSLLIGRMRPADRDSLIKGLKDLKSGVPRLPEDPVRFVVATQTLEVGADLDFDILISECAAIDSLLQRFGRLNRIGAYPSSKALVVIGAEQIQPKQPDPIYSSALASTWAWLNSQTSEGVPLDFGIESEDPSTPTVGERLNSLAEEVRKDLRTELKCSPVLLPAHLDALCQTNPAPCYEPAVDLFLHGFESGEPDVQVIWRADLNSENASSWENVISLCPPVSAEAMTVPISAFRRWFAGSKEDQNSSDLERNAILDPPDKQVAASSRKALLYRKKKSKVAFQVADIKPADTIILPASAGGWDELGHAPGILDGDSSIDLAELAHKTAKHQLILRLHPEILKLWPMSTAKQGLVILMNDPETELDPRKLINYIAANSKDIAYDPATEIVKRKRKVKIEKYPGSNHYVLSRKLDIDGDDGDDETSDTKPVLLADHIRHVEEATASFKCLIEDKVAAFSAAATLHDHGKSDIRFQALLWNGNTQIAQIAPTLAKSGSMASSKQQRDLSRKKSGLPEGFRHELLSLSFAPPGSSELTLHLIASHHGNCRPFAPVIIDPAPPPAKFGGISVSAEARLQNPAHHLSSGVAERFWLLTRRYGWWGLAYYEAVFRLADWQASSDEMRKDNPE